MKWVCESVATLCTGTVTWKVATQNHGRGANRITACEDTGSILLWNVGIPNQEDHNLNSYHHEDL